MENDKRLKRFSCRAARLLRCPTTNIVAVRQAQRAARAALASSTAPSDAAPPAPSGAGAKEKRVQAVAECSQVSGIVGWLKEQRAT